MGMHDFPEKDWRIFRELREGALERFYVSILAEASTVANDAARPPHDRYVNLWKLLKERDRELSNAFDNPRRSTALQQLLWLLRLDLIDDEDLERFSEETRKKVATILSL